MFRLDRRAFLGRTPLAAGTLLALNGLTARAGALAKGAPKGAGGYGPLRPTKTKNTGEELLALPENFQYTVFGKTGDKMSDGFATPASHDGMAAFAVGREWRLVRNHEINNRLGREGAAFGDPKLAYDPLAGGGTTTLVIDPKTRELVKSFVSLNGTLQNCAGGPTPWGSWITCEETVLGETRRSDPQNNRELGGFTKPHGYCYEVSAAADGAVAPVALKAMGRFVHEAVAVDPATGVVYETEDASPGGFFRLVPKERGRLSAGGRLQMLAVKGSPNYDTRAGQQAGKPLAATWVEIADPDPAAAETNSHAVYEQGLSGGGATFARLEGCWYGDRSIFFTSTSGGDQHRGQVWRYQPRGEKEGLLTLIFESPGAETLDYPDNICVSPRGGLVICEDGGGEEQFLRGLTPRGQLFDLGRNMVPGFETKEWAGATFSPDGGTLFVNIQTPGLTFAIWGPWQEGAL